MNSRQDALTRAWYTARSTQKAQFVFKRGESFVIADTPPPLNAWPHSEVLRVEPVGTYSSVSPTEVNRALRE